MEQKKQGQIARITQKNNLEETLISKITSSGFDIKKRDFQFYGIYKPIIEYEDQIELAVSIYDKIVDCADIYFGIRASQLSEALTKSVVRQIMSDYPELTIEEIEHCFERFVQPKTDWRNITKMELIEPIKKYYSVKAKIKIELNKIETEKIAEEEGLKRSNEFHLLAIDCYKKSLVQKKWLGDIFLAYSIHRYFRTKFTDPEIIDMKAESQKLYNYYQNENSFQYFAYSKERILAEIVVKIAIKNKWNIKD